ncbi:MAG: 16S rRNA (adenine(1518)-N(6)/adenine(1519)-N(6))-dimethyltransferase RsmA [Candidatus Micrarchaeota archaeon]
MGRPYLANNHFPSRRQKKKLSQVFLRDYSAISEVFDNLDLKGKTVLEIGAGTGSITRVLVEKAKKVIALEIDPDACAILKENLSNNKNLEILCVDALQASLDYPVIVGFLPYHLSSPLLFRILGSGFEEAILCVQKEFAIRMVAEPGTSAYSKLSVMAQCRAEITYLATVPKSAFSPVPKVDSALVYLVKRQRCKLNEALVSALFQHKNQNLRKALLHSKKALGLTKESIDDFLRQVPLQKKARSLSLEEIAQISVAFERFIS